MAIRTLAFLVLAVCAATVVACNGDDDGGSDREYTRDSVAARGPHGVGVTTMQFVDTTRGLPPNGDFPGEDERRLVVDIWYPASGATDSAEDKDAPPATDDGPYPLIIFAHGFTASRVQSASYTQHLASHGYVVAAPDFPASFGGAKGGPRLSAVTDQPDDVRFLIDRMLELDAGDEGPMSALIDEERIGITGHSLGGLTSLLSIYGKRRDDRIDAALPISPPACFISEDVVGETVVPIMVVGGSIELIVNPGWIRRAYDLATSPRYFAEITGGDHIRFADVDIRDTVIGSVSRIVGQDAVVRDAIMISQDVGSDITACTQNVPIPEHEAIEGNEQRRLLRAVALPFFDAYLREDEDALRFLQEELPGLEPGVHFEMDAPDELD
jgi:predicted dienelactone hydrolase